MISARELGTLINDVGMYRASLHICDKDYGVPSRDYIQNDFPKWWARKLKDQNLDKWEPNNDCDNFAWLMFVDMQWAHYNTKQSTAQGLSFGVVYYMAKARAEGGGGGGHAINVAIVGDRDNREVIFVEPQLVARGRPGIITLTPEEIESAWFVNF